MPKPDEWENQSEDLRELTELLGEEAVELLLDHFGGSYIYIPKRETLERSQRDSAIRKSYFDGANRRVLARRYQLSERQIRRILNYSAASRQETPEQRTPAKEKSSPPAENWQAEERENRTIPAGKPL